VGRDENGQMCGIKVKDRVPSKELTQSQYYKKICCNGMGMCCQ